MIKIISNCDGCEEEWEEAIDWVRKGYHLATTKNYHGPGIRNHFFVLIVDDKGKIIVS